MSFDVPSQWIHALQTNWPVAFPSALTVNTLAAELFCAAITTLVVDPLATNTYSELFAFSTQPAV